MAGITRSGRSVQPDFDSHPLWVGRCIKGALFGRPGRFNVFRRIYPCVAHTYTKPYPEVLPM